MTKQFIINVDTSQTPAVQAFDTSAAPVTTPPISATCEPVAEYDSIDAVTSQINSVVNYALLEAVRGS